MTPSGQALRRRSPIGTTAGKLRLDIPPAMVARFAAAGAGRPAAILEPSCHDEDRAYRRRNEIDPNPCANPADFSPFRGLTG